MSEWTANKLGIYKTLHAGFYKEDSWGNGEVAQQLKALALFPENQV